MPLRTKPPKRKGGKAMQVTIKDIETVIAIGSKGIEFGVHRGGAHLGDLQIGKAKITWCKGRSQKGKGKERKKNWTELIAFFMNSPDET